MEPLRIENLFARRSVRRYTGEAVTPAQVEILLQAAMSAPSAGNRKPWQFIVVTARETREALAAVHPYAKMLPQAPLAIVACGEPASSFAEQPEWWVEDVSAAVENILLAATGLGLGAVWCGVYPDDDRVRAFREILGVPPRVTPFALIPVGHPAEKHEPRTQYDPQRVHRERW
jgi:nitroreductase